MMEVFDQRRYLIPFRSLLLPQIFTDVLVIGGGVAGLSAAIEAASQHDVILLLKSSLDVSASAWAQGGIAAAFDTNDSTQAHFDDTIYAGSGLCDESAVRTLVEDGPGCIHDLLDWGMRFDRDESGEIAFGREAAHGHPRILHTDGASTGRELVRCLAQRLQSFDSVRTFDRCFAVDLLTTDVGDRRVFGAITHHPRFGLQIIWAKSTILASGGAGQLYRETTNPRVATGDGVAMAYRAGARIADAEFVQFHPTTLYVAGASRMLISEAVRGEGAKLIDADGHRFMPDYHEHAELAPRDVVSRAIVDRLSRTQAPSVFLDVRHLADRAFAHRFPTLVKELATFDINPADDLIPVHPSAHYSIGGVWTDLAGRTNLPGLFACGEVSCTGVHGANRLASNSLLEGLVFGRRAGQAAIETPHANGGPMKIISAIPIEDHAELDLVDVRSSLRSTMWRNVGIVRRGRTLDDVLDMLRFWARYTMDVIFDEPHGWETQNMLLLGMLVTRAARWREESRGVHWRDDHPEPAEHLAVHALWTTGESAPRLEPVKQHQGLPA